MKTYSPDELKEVIRLHALWLADANGGVRANLSGADLSGAYLNRANLNRAYLNGAYLNGAHLRGADLSRANLSGADLRGADLSGADLNRANLNRAYLNRAYLNGANLSGADLCGADLCGADLSRANLSGANLSGADGINVLQIGPIGSRRATTTYWIDEDRVVCGCWNDYQGGSLEDFVARVSQEHADNPRFLAEYNAAIAMFRVAREFGISTPRQ